VNIVAEFFEIDKFLSGIALFLSVLKTISKIVVDKKKNGAYTV